MFFVYNNIGNFSIAALGLKNSGTTKSKNGETGFPKSKKLNPEFSRHIYTL